MEEEESYHENDIANGGYTSGMKQLLHNLSGREIVLEAHGPRGAELAAHFTTDLGGNAQGRPGTARPRLAVVFPQPRVVSHNHGLNKSPILKKESAISLRL